VCVAKELDLTHSNNRSDTCRLGGCAHSQTVWSICWCAQLFDLIFLLKFVLKRECLFRCYNLCGENQVMLSALFRVILRRQACSIVYVQWNFRVVRTSLGVLGMLDSGIKACVRW